MRGDAAKAAHSRERLLKVVPTFTIARYVERFHPTLTAKGVALNEKPFIPGLRRAGVPE